jgi:hypothetical protein
LINYYDGLEADRLALTQALEIIQEIQLGASMDAMVLVDRYVKNFQISRTNDGSLDTALKEVDEYNIIKPIYSYYRLAFLLLGLT